MAAAMHSRSGMNERLDGVFGTVRCANCGAVYGRDSIAVVGNRDEYWFVRCTCETCGTQGLGVVIVKRVADGPVNEAQPVVVADDQADRLHVVDVLEVSSYGAGTTSTGVVRILKDLAKPIEGRNVLVVEDILDTGHTLSYVIEHLRGQHPSTLGLCALLDKPARRVVPITVDYKGFEIPDKFVVGYGLDFAERYRNLPFIRVLKSEVYARLT